MRVPYIKINQRNEEFFLVKFNAIELRKLVEFHFRDPYFNNNKLNNSFLDNSDYDSEIDEEFYTRNRFTFDKYVNEMERKGIELKYTNEGIQRKIEAKRINEIRGFFSDHEDNFLANSVLLSVDATKLNSFETSYNENYDQETGYFDFDESVIITIIDGQHRLAGLFLCNDELLMEIEIPAVLLINSSISTAAKLFSTINGKQKAVSKSVIYDLSEHISKSNEYYDEEFSEINKLHVICQNFYSDPKSPLYRHIKMLGIGDGAISQAFFIESVRKAVKISSLQNLSIQSLYEELYYYFKSFQRIFKHDWPVVDEYSSVEDFKAKSKIILSKSQLLKTTGFGAIMRLFPHLYKEASNLPGKEKFRYYCEVLEKLKMIREDIFSSKNFQGTGKKTQTDLYKEICKVLNIKIKIL